MPKLTNRPSIVYLAINTITGERYIGFTSQRLTGRKARHRSSAKKGRTRFAAALRQYDWGIFAWHVIGRFNTAGEASDFEQRLIRHFRPEYNGTKGGEAYRKRNVSDAERARLVAEGHRNIKKWRRYAKLGPQSMARPVICLSDGKRYPSASAAARAYKIEKTIVIEVCNRSARRRLAGGRVFRYQDDPALESAPEVYRLQHGPWKKGTNPYKNVHPHTSEGKNTGRWRARISFGGRNAQRKYSLGVFDTAEEAHMAVLKAERDLARGRVPRWLSGHTPRAQRQIQVRVLGVPATVAR